jgi:hypothetical protein
MQEIGIMKRKDKSAKPIGLLLPTAKVLNKEVQND